MTGAAQEQGQKATQGPTMTEKAQGKAAEMQHRAGGWVSGWVGGLGVVQGWMVLGRKGPVHCWLGLPLLPAAAFGAATLHNLQGRGVAAPERSTLPASLPLLLAHTFAQSSCPPCHSPPSPAVCPCRRDHGAGQAQHAGDRQGGQAQG